MDDNNDSNNNNYFITRKKSNTLSLNLTKDKNKEDAENYYTIFKSERKNESD